MADFAYGNYVIYQGLDLDRVIAVRDGGNVSVCYSTGFCPDKH